MNKRKIANEIKALEQRIAGNVDYDTYMKQHPKSKKTRNDPMFAQPQKQAPAQQTPAQTPSQKEDAKLQKLNEQAKAKGLPTIEDRTKEVQKNVGMKPAPQAPTKAPAQQAPAQQAPAQHKVRKDKGLVRKWSPDMMRNLTTDIRSFGRSSQHDYTKTYQKEMMSKFESKFDKSEWSKMDKLEKNKKFQDFAESVASGGKSALGDFESVLKNNHPELKNMHENQVHSLMNAMDSDLIIRPYK